MVEPNFTERKKAMKKTLLEYIIAYVVVCGIFILADLLILRDVVFGLVIAAIMFPIIVYIYLSELRGIKRSFCPHCGKKYDYNADIEWEVSSEEEKERSIVAYVDVECSCTECGETNSFTVKRTTATVDPKTGRVKQYNIQNSMKKYFYKAGKK